DNRPQVSPRAGSTRVAKPSRCAGPPRGRGAHLHEAHALKRARGADRDTVLALTCEVVVFSILVQGLTVGRVARNVREGSREAGGGTGRADGISRSPTRRAEARP